MRRTTGAAVLVGAVVSLAACGGGDEPTAATSTGSTTSSSSTTTTTSAPTTTTATPTTALPPLSRFENDPRVKALRAYAAQGGRAVNANDSSYKPWLATMSRRAIKERGQYINEDLGLYYPGPIPFTPVKVTDGSRARIEACFQFQGWALNPKTKEPARPAKIGGAAVYMVKVDGKWVFDQLFSTKTDCSNVKVVGRAW